MARLDGRSVGLDGVVAEQANYVRSGFVLAHRNIRFAGTAKSSETANHSLVELRGSRPVGFAGSLVAYDRSYFPAPREAFLRRWIAQPGHRTVAFVEGDAIRGFGTVRPCRQGYKVGPLYAETERIADALFSTLIARLHGAQIVLDVPEPNGAAVALAESHGLAAVFETARMYRGPVPELPWSRTYGVTSFELG